MGGGVGGRSWCNFFPREFFFQALSQFPVEKTVTLPLVWPKKVMTFPMLKDMTAIIK